MMEKTMDCSDFRDDMLDVLYGEASEDVAARFATHAESCAACRDDLSGLNGVRQDLQAWGDESAQPAPRRYWPQMRGLAIAASLLLAFGAGFLVSHTEVRDGAVAVRFRDGAPPSGDFPQDLVRQTAENRAAIEALKVSFSGAPGTSGGALPAGGRASSSEEALLRKVQEMIRASEARQQVVMQTSLSELGQQSDAQRRYDLARISAGLSYLESKTGADVARTNELMSHLVRVAAPPENEK
jgi:hypothetical protein